jgi:hypothetical protein
VDGFSAKQIKINIMQNNLRLALAMAAATSSLSSMGGLIDPFEILGREREITLPRDPDPILDTVNAKLLQNKSALDLARIERARLKQERKAKKRLTN